MLPFDSSKFFDDPFFIEPDTAPVTIGGVEFAAVVTEKETLSQDGLISSRTGRWLEVAIMTPATLPAIHSEITVRGTVYRVETIAPSGDVTVLTVLADQRRK